MTLHFVTDRGDSRLRLDQILARRVTAVSRMSRTRAQTWIAEGLVSVDGAPVMRASVRVREGAGIAVMIPATTPLREPPQAEDLPLEILYEDGDLLAINKPAGTVVHPSFRNLSGTILNAVLWHCRERDSVRPGLVSRLDKDTSGVLLIALSPGAHARIQRDAVAGLVTKEYVAIVEGTPRPSRGTIDLPLAHDPADRRRIIVADGGMPAVTRYRVASGDGVHSLVECELVTGRTHQIRVHMAARGWPVAGDRVYGHACAAIERQALHAWRLSLPHPVSRAALRLEAPMPRDMRALLGDP